jgi:cytochrome c553
MKQTVNNCNYFLAGDRGLRDPCRGRLAASLHGGIGCCTLFVIGTKRKGDRTMAQNKIFLLSVGLIGMMLSAALAAGNAARGKILFDNPKFADGVRACSDCHPDGRGLENAARRKVFHIAGGTQRSLAEAVNACIVNAAGGKAIDPNSAEMKDIVAYITSLKSGRPTDGY